MATDTHLHQPTALQPADGPWMRNKQWAAGRISDGSVANVVIVWIFTLIWNAFSWVIAFALITNPGNAKGPVRFLVIVFPFIGLLALAGAIYLTVRYLKFGRSYFELETLPGCVGGWLAGTVRTSAT